MVEGQQPTVIGMGEKTTEIVVPEEISEATHLGNAVADEVVGLVTARAEGRSSGRTDAIVVLEQWATTWPDFDDPVANSTVVLAGEVEDYSDKAILCTKAYNVHTEKMKVASVEDGYVSDFVSIIDETDDGAPNEGRTFFPKSALERIFVLE